LLDEIFGEGVFNYQNILDWIRDNSDSEGALNNIGALKFVNGSDNNLIKEYDIPKTLIRYIA
jgi:hypothetical protein